MTKDEFKALARGLRMAAQVSAGISGRAYGTCRARGHDIATIHHGGTYWTIRYTIEPGAADAGLTCRPAIIRDRTPGARAAVEMAWCAHFRGEARRMRGDYYRHVRAQKIDAARLCVADARAIRLAASAFHAV